MQTQDRAVLQHRQKNAFGDLRSPMWPSRVSNPLCFEEEGLTEIVHKRLRIYRRRKLLEWR